MPLLSIEIPFQPEITPEGDGFRASFVNQHGIAWEATGETSHEARERLTAHMEALGVCHLAQLFRPAPRPLQLVPEVEGLMRFVE